ncbi:hypothetical protein QA612_10895 [Evansella sp. AB-P1]|nr:hypothetical protein [Evansella sp. AB-P1]MDG5787996.1 hypothetical protein [Evansella sp. AB-P1]
MQEENYKMAISGLLLIGSIFFLIGTFLNFTKDFNNANGNGIG